MLAFSMPGLPEWIIIIAAAAILIWMFRRFVRATQTKTEQRGFEVDSKNRHS